MTKAIKKTLMILSAIAGLCIVFFGLSVFKNKSVRAEGVSVTVSLNGGFMIKGSAYAEGDVSFESESGSITLTKENVKNMLGGEYVYQKGTAGIYDDVTVNENGTWNPKSDKELPAGMLFGFFYDDNGNGIADENETIYRRGDELPLFGGATLKCYYEQNYVYVKVHGTNEVMLKRATKDLNENLNAFQAVYTSRDLQPMLADLTIIGPNAFTYNFQTSKNRNQKTTSVELPVTVKQLRDEAFFMCSKLANISGLDNVELVGSRTFVWCGQDASKNETMVLEFGDKIKAFGNMKAVENIGGAGNRGTVFAMKRSNVRIIFNGKASESSPLQTPVSDVSQFQTGGVGDFFVYVPKGTTDAWYPTDNCAERMKDSVTQERVGMREMIRINYDLNGGNVEGRESVKTQYLDYGAAEVMREGKEVNILAHNPASQDFSKLNTVRFVSPAKHASVFSHWETESGDRWKESDFKNEEKLKTLTEDTVFKAIWIDSIGSVTIDFNGGFHASGENVSDGSFEYFYIKNSEVLTPENARVIVGYECVYLKGTAGTYKDGIEIGENGMFVPRNDAAIPTGLAFGLFYDYNGNGKPDNGETLYKTGDTLPLVNGATLKVYYEHNVTFAKRATEGEVTVKRATSGYDGDSLNAFREVYEAEVFTPLLSETVKIGESAFSGYSPIIDDKTKAEDYKFNLGYNNITVSVELPKTVREIDKDAFMYSLHLSQISGLDNVETLGYRSFVHVGQRANTSETLYLVFGENVREIGTTTGGNVFNFNRPNVRIIFNGDSPEVSPFEAPSSRDDKNNSNFYTNNKTDTLFVYVPKGATENWYPSEEKYAVVMKDRGSSPTELVCIREMYRISYDLNGGTVNGKDIVAKRYIDAGAVSVKRGDNEEVNLTDYSPAARMLNILNTVDAEMIPVKGDLLFEYWIDQHGKIWTCEDLADEQKLNGITEDLTLTAYYDHGLDVILHFNNGQEDYIANVRYNTAIRDYNIYSVSCYNFAGWYKSADFSKESFYGLTIDSVKESIELYAKYEPIECVAKLYLTGGTYEGKLSEFTSMTYNYGEEAALPNASEAGSLITRKGHRFIGWYDNDDFFGEPLTRIPAGEYAPSYYAKWESEELYAKIEYVLDGGENPADAPTEYRLGDETELPFPERYGYSFKGWYLTPDLNGECLERIDGTFSGDVKLYACWKDNGIRSITYVLNGGKNNENNAEEFYVGTRTILYNPARKNFAFEGWYSSSNYDESSKVEIISEAADKDVTLYAKWKRINDVQEEEPDVEAEKKTWNKFAFQFTCGCIVVGGFFVALLIWKKLKNR